MNIADQPIIDYGRDEARRLLLAGIHNDGRTARAIGIPFDKCPPFVDPAMEDSWKEGWKWEDSSELRRILLGVEVALARDCDVDAAMKLITDARKRGLLP